MTRIIFTICFCISTLIYGQQAFQVSTELLYNPDIIALNNVKSVTAYCDCSDSLKHPLNTFVFKYEFNSTGNIVDKIHWSNLPVRIKNASFLLLSLEKDTLFTYSETKKWAHKTIMRSKIIKLRQKEGYRRVTPNYVPILNKIQKSFTTFTNGSILITNDNYLVVDTIILGHKVYLPTFLFPKQDSMIVLSDRIVSFNQKDNVLFNKSSHFFNDKNQLVVSYYSDWNTEEVWRTYIFDNNGRLAEEIQNRYKTVYHYSSNGLLTSVIDYTDNSIISRITFKYQ